jgi:hypothetical protein
MTAAQIADRLQARRTGPGRWIARCPAHADRSPSLGVREGGGGRVLLCCHAGCTLSDTLKALGLRVRDLFPGPPPSPAQQQQAAAERQKREEQEREQRKTNRATHEQIRKLEGVVNALGAELADLPDDSPAGPALTALFDATVDRLHRAEMRSAR